MKRYILANSEGLTPDKQSIREGKFVHSIKAGNNDPIVKVIQSGFHSPHLAVLEHDDSTVNKVKLFMFHTWTVGVDMNNPKAYTVVKEVPVPSASLDKKLAFSIAAASEIFANEEFVKWAEDWLADIDRSAITAEKMHTDLKKEMEAASALGELAAWGETSGSDSELVHEQEKKEHLALNVSKAASLFGKPDPDSNEVLAALRQTNREIDHYASKLNLDRLAEKVFRLAPSA
ncbi:MAG: hypothetical protein BMS9Abin36_0251 [Gammaproteobacteria bacterium]|nr:MAG: hypothetical protein BMS9Abin36_0251 [Gammaproteobacteria bacterium]